MSKLKNVSLPEKLSIAKDVALSSSKRAAMGKHRSRIRRFLKILGPGLVTGAADDDPSGIATYATAGASLGLMTLWTAFLTFPLMAAVQHICARIGMVSGQGLAAVFRKHYSKKILYPAVFLLVVANTINLGADLGAIAEAVQILTGWPLLWMVPPIGLAILAFQVFGRYKMIAKIFKWLTLALFAYIIDVLVVQPNLRETLYATFVPTFSMNRTYITTLVAIIGTTISPYLFFWQTNQEVEEEREKGRKTIRQRRGASSREIQASTLDVNIGMSISNLVMYFIILTMAVTLFKNGQTTISSGAEAAEALKPLAGRFAGLIFAVGMIGAGMLAVPVLSGSTAYAVCEAFGWKAGLDEKWRSAKHFYEVIGLSTLIGIALPFSRVNPIDALFWTAVLNGIIAPPLLVLIMFTARNRKVMGRHVISPLLTFLGWSAAIAMALALIALIYTSSAGNN